MVRFKLNGYSIAENRDLMSAYLCFSDVVLPRKIKRESKAAEIFRQFRGRYTDKMLERVFNLADEDPTGSWFGPMLSKPNRNLLYDCPMEEINNLFDKLLGTAGLGELSQWRHAGNRGMNAGAATLLMYLSSPDSYNIWNPTTHRGLSKLYRLDAEYPKQKKLTHEKYNIFYKIFNHNAIAVREENGLVPQAMDWFLWAVDQIKENRDNRHLRAYIEGRTK
jgi:hypothetical protein